MHWETMQTGMQQTMSETKPIDPAGDRLSALQERLKGSNINEQTLLATDYLNHFNEIVMTLEMVADMPELLAEAKAWTPKTYQEHFLDSTFSDKDLAIEAYEIAPARYRKPFEAALASINGLIALTIERAEAAVAAGETERLRHVTSEACRLIQRLMDVASAIIHGSDKTLDQGEIDRLMG